jgi:signal transduction histidine kinase
MAFGIEFQDNRLLAALPDAERQRWFQIVEPVDLRAGEVLYQPGRPPAYAYFPLSAVVSLLLGTAEGAGDEVAVVGCEGVVGVPLFMGTGSTTGSAVVQSPGRAFRVPAQALEQTLADCPAVMPLLLKYIMALSAQVAQTAVCNRHHTLAHRLCRRLLLSMDRQGNCDITITQEQLGHLLGVRRESVTAELDRLQKAGAIRKSRGRIGVIDRSALERGACECYVAVEREYVRLAPRAARFAYPAQDRILAAAPCCPPAPPAPSPVNRAAVDLTTYMQEMRDQERGDLARELHDELGSLLTAAKLDIAMLKTRLADVSSDVDQRLLHLGKTIDKGIAFSRQVVEGLHPSSLANLGLTASLEILVREFGANTGIAMETNIEEADFDAKTQLTVYRVVQEALNNAGKYSHASHAKVSLLDCGSDIVMAVRDDGDGFDTMALGTSSHGLAGMRHRVQSHQGQFSVTSDHDSGTLVVAVFPKTAGADDFRPAGQAVQAGLREASRGKVKEALCA